MKKRFYILPMAMALIVSACSATQVSETKSEKLSIVTTIFPQYDFTRQIVGEHANVEMLLKPGAESHSYEPTPQDIKKIQNSDLFIYTGGENDVWVDHILSSMGDKKPQTLRLIDCVKTVNEEVVEGMEHEHEHEAINANEIEDRTLNDFAGSYKSVVPYIENGTFDEPIAFEAKEHGLTFEEMKEEFISRRKSDYSQLHIENNTLTLGENSADYEYAGIQTVKEDDEIVSVWYAFQLKSPHDQMPKYVLFNDHQTKGSISKDEVAHFHMRYGDESIEALVNTENWAPTYYALDASSEAIKEVINEHSHDEEIDEHVWTSPKNVIEIVNKITSILSEKDPSNASVYETNSAAYKEQLMALDASFREVIDQAKIKTILFGDRFPFRYFADEYGLNYYAAFTGCSTETEASAATVAFLINKVKEKDLPTVFTIELSNGQIADSIVEATGAKKVTLYSCHNVTKDQMAAGATYLSMMQENVESLRKALN